MSLRDKDRDNLNKLLGIQINIILSRLSNGYWGNPLWDILICFVTFSFLQKKPKRPYDVKTFSIVWKSQLLEFCAHRQACNKVNCDQFQHFRPPSLSFDGSFVHWTIYCKIPAAEIDPRGCFPLLFTLDPSLLFLFTKLNVVLD